MVLTEVAAPTLEGEHGTSLPVTVAEKGPAWRTVTARGVSGHGSQPFARNNAVVELASAVHDIATTPQPTRITKEWKAFVPHLPLDADLRDSLLDAERVDAAIEQIAAKDPTLARWIHACTHLTFSPNVFAGGSKANVVPASASADIDIRLLPGQHAGDVAAHLRTALGPNRFDTFDIQPVLEMEANSSQPAGVLWDAIEAASEVHTGSRVLAPTLTPVATDARFFRAKGIPAFGVGLFDGSVSFPEMLAMFHGADERVSVTSVRRTTAFLATVVQQLARARDKR